MKHYILIVAVSMTAWHLSNAAPLVFQDHNCAIEFPSNWQTINPPPPESLTVALSPDDQKAVSLNATKIRAGDQARAVQEMNTSLKKLLSSEGQQVVESQKMLAGISFHTFSAKASGKTSVTTYSARAGDQLYVLQASSEVGDAGSDAELQSIISSFRLLSTANNSTEKTTPNGAAYRGGYIFGKLLGLGLIGMVVVWLIRKVSS